MNKQNKKCKENVEKSDFVKALIFLHVKVNGHGKIESKCLGSPKRHFHANLPVEKD